MRRGLMVLLAAVGLAACTNSVTVFRGGDGGAGPIDDDGGGDPSPCGSCEDPSVCSVASCMGDTCVVEHLFGNTCSAAGFDGVCDGFGNCVAADCDVEFCEDDNACTVDSCTLDACIYQPTASGTPCGQDGPVDLMCNGVGSCVECLTASDCQHIPATTECATRICQGGGVCGQVFAPSGSLLSAMLQSPGDCHQAACDGMGAVFLVVDDSDAPDDNDPCTLHYCTLGTPVTAPKCGPTQQCFGGNCFP